MDESELTADDDEPPFRERLIVLLERLSRGHRIELPIERDDLETLVELLRETYKD